MSISATPAPVDVAQRAEATRPFVPPECPRCGYDLSGMIGSWRESCPMEARCSECGLEFECWRVLNPKLARPMRHFEYAQRGLLRSFFGTTGRSFVPRRLFGVLRIEHRVMTGRLILFMLVWLFVAHGTAAAIRAALHESQVGPVSQLTTAEWGALLAWPYSTVFSAWGLRLPGIVVSMSVVPSLTMSLLMLTLGQTLARAKLRRIHLLRGIALSLPGTLTGALLMWCVVWNCWRLNYQFLWLTNYPVLVALAAAMPLWLMYWWWVFLREYLQLRHAWVIATVLGVPVFLSGAAGVLWCLVWSW